MFSSMRRNVINMMKKPTKVRNFGHELKVRPAERPSGKKNSLNVINCIFLCNIFIPLSIDFEGFMRWYLVQDYQVVFFILGSYVGLTLTGMYYTCRFCSILYIVYST